MQRLVGGKADAFRLIGYQWFPPKRITWSGKKATIRGFAHEIRKVRNCVHPGVWARERSEPLRFTKGVYGVIYQVDKTQLAIPMSLAGGYGT
jgi:hypothetical protein